jgi:hypothetical protein
MAALWAHSWTLPATKCNQLLLPTVGTAESSFVVGAPGQLHAACIAQLGFENE